MQHLSKSINSEPKDLKRDGHAKQPCLGKECLQWLRLGAPCAKNADEDCRLLNQVFRCHPFFLVVIGPLRCRSDWWRRHFVWHDNGIVFNNLWKVKGKGPDELRYLYQIWLFPSFMFYHVLPTLPLSYSCQVQAAGLGVAMMMPGSTVLAMGLKPQWFGRSWGRAIFSREIQKMNRNERK